jgi:hypothetical protein
MEKNNEARFGYKMLKPNGDFYAFCAKRKYNRYIAKKLCTVIDDKTIQLLFEPKVKSDKFIYVFSNDSTKNKCSCCSKEEGYDEENDEDIKLCKHNIVPFEFLKWYPDKNLDANYNRILLCNNCKDIYNSEQHSFRQKILEEFNLTNTSKDNNICPAKIIVEKLIADNKLNEFSQKWKDHFINTMLPTNMPNYIEQ